MSENIILTGFMGTGKTTAGKILARKLSRTFIDMDEYISENLGKPIHRIFIEDGEAIFRELEAELCIELSQRENLVIATGGGTLVNPDNMLILKRSGRMICLKADVETIFKRVQDVDHPTRPLLDDENKRGSIINLLRERDARYQAIPWQINTCNMNPNQVVEKVSAIARAVGLNVRSPSGAYPIWIGDGLLSHSGDVFYQAGIQKGSKVVVVSVPHIAEFYAPQVISSLQERGYQPVLCLIEDGEENKTLKTIMHLYDQLLSAGLEREDTVLALGGGVIGDLAGFAAATIQRGVRIAQIPTTLLAMVDSSIGGKTGVNLPQGKNLVGAFKQPCLVLMDPKVLQSLPEPEIRSGIAEVIKHGIISDSDLFEALEKSSGDVDIFWQQTVGASLIANAVQVKKSIVEDDPFEQGVRAYLNLGHTTGHALEKISNYNLRHGEAVSIGIVVATRIAEKLGIIDPKLSVRIEKVLKLWKLPVKCPPFSAEDIYQAMQHDKKKQSGRLRWVLPCKIGEVSIHKDIPAEVIISELREIGAK